MSNLSLSDAGIDSQSFSSIPAVVLTDATPDATTVVLTGVTKRFGSVVACDNVDLTLHGGRIYGLLGENGAGKSTLMKMMIGLVLPDAGEITIDNQQVHIANPQSAAALGIGMVHQHFSLVDALTVWENITLGDSGRLDANATRYRVAELAEQYGLKVNPDKRVADLPPSLRQRVEILKCLRRDPNVIIFDEPSSLLVPEETEQLFASLRQVVDTEKRVVVLVSHKLDEVLGVADEINVMRQGKVVDRFLSSTVDAQVVAQAMLGREVSLRSERTALGWQTLGRAELPGGAELAAGAELATGAESPAGAESLEQPTSPPLTEQNGGAVLSIREARTDELAGEAALKGFSLDIYPGEIVAVFGGEGSEQRVLVDVLSSLMPLASGVVSVCGSEVPSGVAGAMARTGVGVIPQDRHDSGLVLEMTVAENLLLANQPSVVQRGLINRNRTNRFAAKLIEQYQIVCAGPGALMWTVSGGNQQRVLLARELAGEPKVLVAAQPTRGLDVGAIEHMNSCLKAATEVGVAVLLISNDLEEITELATRILVFQKGRIVDETQQGDFTALRSVLGGARL